MNPDAPTAVPYATFGDPQTLNLYAYVNNNPNTGIDMDGHVDGFGNDLPTGSFEYIDNGKPDQGGGNNGNNGSGSNSTSPSGQTSDENGNDRKAGGGDKSKNVNPAPKPQNPSPKNPPDNQKQPGQNATATAAAGVAAVAGGIAATATLSTPQPRPGSGQNKTTWSDVWNVMKNPPAQLCQQIEKKARVEMATAGIAFGVGWLFPPAMVVTDPLAAATGISGGLEEIYTVVKCP